MHMLSVEDVRNLITLINRSTYGNLNEAKVGVTLEQKLKSFLTPPAPIARPPALPPDEKPVEETTEDAPSA